MKNQNSNFSLSCLSAAILMSLSGSSIAQTNDEETMEEVVAVGSRLKGSATAVLDERKQQAFVADIMGAEQISRSGDSDAAAALRRVTGLTLVDGKFIYVRGLGERYSSTQLNSSSVPSPDPTRSVIPLDLFPSDIIESLSVQKSYSPSMPGNFGGGNVDIRTKSIPSDFLLKFSAKLGSNTANSDNGLSYAGGADDKFGLDDDTRKIPSSIAAVYQSGRSLDDLTPEQSKALLLDLNRNVDPVKKDVGPDYGFNFAAGNRFESGEFEYGFLATAAYDNKYRVAQESQGDTLSLSEQGNAAIVRGYDQITGTEHAVTWSGMLNLGIKWRSNHQLDLSSTILHDTKDKIRDRLGFSENVNESENRRIRSYDIIYEERELIVNQIRGKHSIEQLNFAGFDWKYSHGRSNRYAPGNLETRFIVTDRNQDGVYDTETEIALTNATQAARYNFQNLDDEVENYGFNFNMPFYGKGAEYEIKIGADFTNKERDATARRFDVNTRAFRGLDLQGHRFSEVLNDEAVNAAEVVLPVLNDTTIDGDDYLAAQKTDAYYFEADMFFNNTWRISGGVRWEDFRQVSAPLDPHTGALASAIDTQQEYLDLAFQEDDFYPALALTYIKGDDAQYRFSYGETVVRPDLREISGTTYIDPLTEFPVRGTPGVRTTSIKNYDFRWENYFNTGENFSVALFYKDMQDPIESVQSPAQDGPPLIRIANAETGYVYGVEFEFLKDFAFLGDFWQNIFSTGNITISDSEIELDRQAIVEQTGTSTAITHTKRRLTGHSEYVVNLQLGFDSPDGQHAATLIYNLFGERIIIPGIEGVNDAMEQPFHSLDFNYTYFPDFNSSVKFKVQNLLGGDQEIEANGALVRFKERGTAFSLSYNYEF